MPNTEQEEIYDEEDVTEMPTERDERFEKVLLDEGGNPWVAYEYASDVIKGRWPEAEEIIKKDTWVAYKYASDVIKGRWPEAEEIIKKDPTAALHYALFVIKGRWPEAEEIIKSSHDHHHDATIKESTEAEDIYDEDDIINIKDKDARYEKLLLDESNAEKCYEYASNVLHHRWPEAEEIIKTDPNVAALYAINVINGRWPEAEANILNSASAAGEYAAHVINGRWPEAEEIIKTSPYAASFYASDIIKGRWLEAEETIKRNADAAAMYVIHAAKRRWPEAEETIMTNPWAAYQYAKYASNNKWPEAEEIIKKAGIITKKDPYVHSLYHSAFIGAKYNMNENVETDIQVKCPECNMSLIYSPIKEKQCSCGWPKINIKKNDIANRYNNVQKRMPLA